MIDALRTELDRETHAGPLAELIAVHAEGEASIAPCLEHAARLRLIEGAALAEHIDGVDERRDRLEHLAAHERDVFVGVAAGWHEVGSEEGHGVGPSARDARRPNLVVDREPVAGLGLEGGGAAAQRFVGQSVEASQQLVVGGRARRIDRHIDAAGGIRLASHASLELVGAVAREHHVRMGVDPARQHGPPIRVEALVGSRCLSRSADPRDAVALDDDSRVANASEVAGCGTALFVVGGQLADAGDEQRSHHCLRIGTATS